MHRSTDQQGSSAGLIFFRTVIILFGIVLGGPLFLFSMGIALEGAANLVLLEFAWGAAGVVGYLSGCVALAMQKPAAQRQQIRVSVGIATGITALLPVLFNPFLFLLAVGPMLCAIALLVYLWLPANTKQKADRQSRGLL